MGLLVALLADDLTGALDSATPFVDRGHAVAVAIGPADIDVAVATGAAVVAVNAASRALPPDAAARIVEDCARRLAAERPAIVFKKVDSRLRGNVSSELAASLRGFGIDRSSSMPSRAARLSRSAAWSGTSPKP